MPTRNRPRFVAQAIRCFDCQTYPNTELIIVDDGERPVGELCAGNPGITYIHLDCPTPTGTKLNLAVATASGDVLQKLDDDDYYGPRFLDTAVTALAALPDRAIVTWDCFLIFMAGESAARFSGHGWNAGGTLCFRRDVWRDAPFRDLWAGSDSQFLDDHASQRSVSASRSSTSWFGTAGTRGPRSVSSRPMRTSAGSRCTLSRSTVWWTPSPWSSIAA